MSEQLADNPTITQSGEQWMFLSLTPHRLGLLVDVRVHTLVEEFMSSLGAGVKDSLKHEPDLRRLVEPPMVAIPGWVPAADGAPLLIYRQDKNIIQDPRYGGNFTISSPSTSLVYDEDNINLSFLRLVGISTGIQFVVTTDIFPIQFRRELKGRIGRAFKQFCLDYIRPIKVTLVVTGREDGY